MRNKLPKTFEDITVEQYQFCWNVLKKGRDTYSWVRVLSFLTEVPIEKLELVDMDKLQSMIQSVQFLVKPTAITKINETILVDNQVYKGIVDITKGKFGQYASLKQELSMVKFPEGEELDWIPVMHKVLGCIYTPVQLFGQDYDMIKCQEQMKKARCGQVFGVVFYYSRVLKLLTPIIQGYLEEAEKFLSDHEKNSQMSTVGT